MVIVVDNVMDAYEMHKLDQYQFCKFQTKEGYIAFLQPVLKDEIAVHVINFYPQRTGIFKRLMAAMKRDFKRIYVGPTDVDYLINYLLRENFVAVSGDEYYWAEISTIK